MGQNSMILEHLRKHRCISQWEATKLYGITRLAARISNLRDAGYNIATVMTEGVSRFGKKTRYATYVLRGEKKNGEERNC
jgi:hypothetical protein